MTNMLITGAAGFIGSHLTDRLLQDGHRVTGYDNLASGRMEWIEHNLDDDRFTFVHADLLDLDALNEAMTGHDVIWHLGANTDIREGNRNTDLDLKNDTIATYNVLEAMRHQGVGKLLFASSATVYGEAKKMPTSEDDGPLFPISLYGAGKLACEGLVSAYSHLFDIQAWMFRFGNVLGSRMGHGVIFDFIGKLTKNSEELEILGDGKQEKPYFLVGDCIDGMLFAFNNSTKQCDVFNLSSKSTVSVSQIAEIVVGEMGLDDVRFRYTGGKRGWPGDVPVVRFDPGKLTRLGWSVRYGAADAVRMATRQLLGRA